MKRKAGRSEKNVQRLQEAETGGNPKDPGDVSERHDKYRDHKADGEGTKHDTEGDPRGTASSEKKIRYALHCECCSHRIPSATVRYGVMVEGCRQRVEDPQKCHKWLD